MTIYLQGVGASAVAGNPSQRTFAAPVCGSLCVAQLLSEYLQSPKEPGGFGFCRLHISAAHSHVHDAHPWCESLIPPRPKWDLVTVEVTWSETWCQKLGKMDTVSDNSLNVLRWHQGPNKRLMPAGGTLSFRTQALLHKCSDRDCCSAYVSYKVVTVASSLAWSSLSSSDISTSLLFSQSPERRLCRKTQQWNTQTNHFIFLSC